MLCYEVKCIELEKLRCINAFIAFTVGAAAEYFDTFDIWTVRAPTNHTIND